MPETSPSTRPDWRRSLARGEHLHRDETGVISLLAVFVILGCTWLLLWVLNSSKQLDSKVRMQNAVDAAGQSGVGILARHERGCIRESTRIRTDRSCGGDAGSQWNTRSGIPLHRDVASGVPGDPRGTVGATSS